MHQITPFPLWLGNAADGRDFTAILDAGIEAVVQAAVEEPPLQLPRELIYCRFPIVDGPNNPEKLLSLATTTLSNLLEKRIPTLVCCGFGLSRSPALAATALAMVYQESPDEWLKRIAGQGHVDVMPGLWNDLKRCQEGNLLL